MKKIIISIFIVFGIMFTGYGIYINLIGSGLNSDAGGTDNDNWSFHGDYIYSDPNGINGGLIAKLVGEINSNLYGTFQFGTGVSTSPIEFRTSTNTTLCGAGNTVFDIVGDIKPVNGIWPTMSFTGDSYYCPGTNSWSGIVYSDLLGYKSMKHSTTSGQLTSSGAGLGAIFNKDSLVVQGLVGKGKNNTVNIGNILNTSNNNSQKTIFIDVGVSKAQLMSLVNKNISLLTNSLTADTNNTTITTLLNNNKSIYYYNYEGNSALSFSNEDNKGKILEISNGNYNPATISSYQVGVSGEKTIIVKGGNIYINADIYNSNNSTSILTLVAKRDSTNNKNGGNIYINPDVTNIDAVLIADGSVINYDGTRLVNNRVVTDSGSLMKQILIYGSLFTKNSIGSPNSPYGSDGYIKYGKNNPTGAVKYDLTKLRHFSLGLSSDTDTICVSPLNYLVPKKSLTGTGSMQYAWAGKRKCYNEPLRTTTDPVVTNLRGSNKFNSVIIKYNPIITTAPPKILRK